jgi:hypothetical protein
MSGSLFGDEISRDARDEAIVSAYEHAGRTLDDLPYTDEFETLITEVKMTDKAATHREVFHRLHNLRKAGKLPRLGRGSSTPPNVSYEDQQLLIGLVAAEAGSLGQRDQLPYTNGYDRVHGEFKNQTGLNLTPHDIWRVIAKLAK